MTDHTIIYPKEIHSLINSEVTGYEIYKQTGISQSVISELRNGKRKFENLSYKTLSTLQQYINELKQQK